MSADARFDRQLLCLLQAGVPLVREPYAQLAAAMTCDERELLGRLAELRRGDGVIREISGIFDATRLGYRQALAAFQVSPDRLDAAGRIVAAHPGVSHCYGREGDFNIWFTLAVSPSSLLGLEPTAARLAEVCAASRRMVLPAIRRYKLRSPLQLDDAATPHEDAPPPWQPLEPSCPPAELGDAQRRAVTALQADLPNRSDPFAEPAREAGMSADDLLVCAADLLAAGCLRRYAAVLRHRQAGLEANVMVAWEVAPAAADIMGARCARQQAVSHCYLRATADGWPYGLYTMIHGRHPRECRMTIERIIAETGLARRAELWTAKEYKKRRVVFFSGLEAAWESGCPPG